MGGTALLTREGEAALAKRIEAGRRAVLDGLCGSLPTVQAVSAWRDAVRGGSLVLRVMIDVEATHGGGRHRYGRADAEAPEHEQEGTDGSGSGRPGLSTMETAVLPRATETLNAIAASCTKLRRLQEQRIELARKNRTLAASQERRRHALQRDLATSIRSLRLTSARIEVVVDDPRVASERLR